MSQLLKKEVVKQFFFNIPSTVLYFPLYFYWKWAIS